MDAAQRFFAAAMRDYGVREGDHVRIPMRQCELHGDGTSPCRRSARI